MSQPENELKFKNEVRKFIAANKIPQAISLMRETADQYGDKESANSILLTERRLQEIKKFEIRGMMTLTESFREQAIVVDSLLSILDGMEVQKEEPEKKEREISNEGGASHSNVVLFLASDPRPVGKLQLEKEFVRIFQGINKTKFFQLESEWAVTPERLQEVVFDHRPRIIHFSGHGTEAGAFARKGIYLQDTQARPQMVEGEALASLFEIVQTEINLELVLLNACDTPSTIEAIHQFVPNVIGMGDKIADDSAIEFATGFYNSLAKGRDYKLAFKLAKNLIALNGLKGSSVPKMLSRDH